MQFRILGPLEVASEGAILPIGGPRQRAVLAALLIDANRVVSADRLLDSVWPDELPRSGAKALHVTVSQLRRALGPAAPIETRSPGYRLDVAPDDLDAARFERLLDEGRAANAAGDAPAALAALDRGLRLWRGSPLADVGPAPFARAEIARLEELRVAAHEERADALLAVGRHAAVIGELEALAAAHPLRERIRSQLMLALYRCGRQADALDVYQETRRLLVDELGLEPGRELRDLEQAILRQDAALAAPDPRAAPAVAPAPEAAAADERKLVTVLFADVVGSAELGERLDPERLRIVLGEYFAAARAAIEAHGGTVEKFIGDAVMAVFGAPIGHEDDAERAVLAAFALRERLAELDAARGDVEVSVRIGVNTGEVVAAAGDQFMVTGEAVNSAARLQQAAAPNEILVGERTYRAARLSVAFDAPRPVAGKAGETERLGWRAAEPVSRRGRRADAAAFVGRRRELTLLRTLFATAVDERHPRLVAVLGQAGIGKTRLVEELVGELEVDGGARVLRGHCPAYGSGVTYWPLRQLLATAAGIRAEDGAADAAAKLETFVGRLADDGLLDSGESRRVIHALATTVGITIPRNPLDEIAPESVGEELALAWPRFLSALAGRGPAVVVVVEDVHWAEPPLLDMLEHVVARGTGPLLIVATGRPDAAELRPRWSSNPSCSHIGVEGLPDADAQELVSALVPDGADRLRERILATAEGNPFFVEEIVRHLADGGELSRRGDVELPDSVRALLAARVDALPAHAKRALQDAAVVGRTFRATALEAVGTPQPGAALAVLEAKGLVVAHVSGGVARERELTFKHGLVRDVAYRSIPRARRARAHAAMAEWIERLAGERRDEYEPLVAHHYAAAAERADAELAWPDDAARRRELAARAARSLLTAGAAARSRFEIDQAIAFAERALTFAADDRERLEAIELHASAAHVAVRADEAWERYRAALAIAERLGDEDAVARLAAGATLLWSRYAGAFRDGGWRQDALTLVDRGMRAAGGERVVSFAVGALLNGRACAHFWGLADSTADDAERDAERSIAIAEAIGSAELLSHGIDSLSVIVGQRGFARAAELGRRLVAAADGMLDRRVAHEMLVTAAATLAAAGCPREAEAAAQEAVRDGGRLGTHPRVHAAAASTDAIVRSGRLAELGEATASVPALVEEEGNQTCFLGFLALAGHALAAYENDRPDDAVRALVLIDGATATLPDPLGYRFRVAELVRPVRGIDATLAAVGRLEKPACPAAEAYRVRLSLQLAAVCGEELGELAQHARSLAREVGAPWLAALADWAAVVELARSGVGRIAERASSVAASLEACGETYLAARLLVDLVPVLDGEERSGVAADAAARLSAMGAHVGAAHARALAGDHAAAR